MIRILIAEDDQAIQKLLCTILRRHGFHVDTANDGLEALRLLGKADYAAVLLDLMMPNLSGWGVVDSVRAERPDLLDRFIIVTAASDADLSVLPPNLRVVRKPFDMTQLVRTLRELVTPLPSSMPPVPQPMDGSTSATM